MRRPALVPTGTEMRLDVQQDIELGLAVPSVPGGHLQVSVLIKLKATATNEKDAKDQVAPLMDDSEYQYVLVAQAFPLAMTHFRRELQALGLDARQLPLGLQ